MASLKNVTARGMDPALLDMTLLLNSRESSLAVKLPAIPSA
jgi:hypothetical protein